MVTIGVNLEVFEDIFVFGSIDAAPTGLRL